MVFTAALLASAIVLAPAGEVADKDDSDGLTLTADVCVQLASDDDNDNELLGLFDNDGGLSLAARVHIALDDDYRDALTDKCEELELL